MAIKNSSKQSVEPRPNNDQSPPTNPQEYSITGHFRKRVTQRGRFITERTAKMTIKHGNSIYYEDRGWRFVKECDGISYIVIVDDIETSPVIVTGWTEVSNEQKALNSKRWSKTHIRIIKLRSALSANNGRKNTEKVRPLILTTPIDIKGHSITTEEGSEYVICENCNLHAESKCELSSSSCIGWRPE